jgi:4'-phosphopantetheinyl transferase
MRGADVLLPLAGVSVEASKAVSVPEHDAWLTEAERGWLSSRRFPKRRMDWRLGRWAGKGAVMLALGSPPLRRDQVEIMAADGGAPALCFLPPNGWPHVSLSLSHSEGVGFAAARPGYVRLGCDVEAIAPRSEAFVSDYFTAAEAARIREDTTDVAARATLLWSAKESALKAIGEGLRVDTRAVEVEGAFPPLDGAWSSVTVAHAAATFRGWWRRKAGFAWSVVLEEGRPGG